MVKSLKFGFVSAREMIGKARRELLRLEGAKTEDRPDHAMNTALTVSHIADWAFCAAAVFGVDIGERESFLRAARNANSDVAAITDIANATKHFSLSRKQKSDAKAVVQGDIIFYLELLPHSSGEPFVPNGGRVRNVRTIIDDDEIVAYETIVTGYRIEAESGARLFEGACNNALLFWEEALGSIENGNQPKWLEWPSSKKSNT